MQSRVLSETGSAHSPAIWRDYFALFKPRVMSLVVFTGLVGALLAPGRLLLAELILAVVCIAAGAGAAGALNMWYERDLDALMARTRNRPLPAGRVEPIAALLLGTGLSIVSVLVLGSAVNWVAGLLLASTIVFYVGIYTIWLKPRTPQNIVIGGAAGAAPPLIGWAAVTGEVSVAALVLFAIIFFWTPPHFWALALYRRDDYIRARIPMLPVVAGTTATIRQMLAYAIILVPLSLAPMVVGIAGRGYTAVALVLVLAYLATIIDLARAPTDARARRAFRFSIIYLAGVFVALLIEGLVGM